MDNQGSNVRPDGKGEALSNESEPLKTESRVVAPADHLIGPGSPLSNDIIVSSSNHGAKHHSIIFHNHKLPVVVFLLIIIGLGLSAYLMHLSNPAVTTKSSANNTTSRSVAVPSSSTTPTSTPICGSLSCFNQKFANCSPAKDVLQSFGSSIQYQINGPQSGGCSVLFEYTNVTNPSWQNVPMTCIFDNNLSIQNSSQDVLNNLVAKKNAYSCSGPLVAIIQSQ